MSHGAGYYDRRDPRSGSGYGYSSRQDRGRSRSRSRSAERRDSGSDRYGRYGESRGQGREADRFTGAASSNSYMAGMQPAFYGGGSSQAFSYQDKINNKQIVDIFKNPHTAVDNLTTLIRDHKNKLDGVNIGYIFGHIMQHLPYEKQASLKSLLPELYTVVNSLISRNALDTVSSLYVFDGLASICFSELKNGRSAKDIPELKSWLDLIMPVIFKELHLQEKKSLSLFFNGFTKLNLTRAVINDELLASLIEQNLKFLDKFSVRDLIEFLNFMCKVQVHYQEWSGIAQTCFAKFTARLNTEVAKNYNIYWEVSKLLPMLIRYGYDQTVLNLSFIDAYAKFMKPSHGYTISPHDAFACIEALAYLRANSDNVLSLVQSLYHFIQDKVASSAYWGPIDTLSLQKYFLAMEYYGLNPAFGMRQVLAERSIDQPGYGVLHKGLIDLMDATFEGCQQPFQTSVGYTYEIGFPAQKLIIKIVPESAYVPSELESLVMRNLMKQGWIIEKLPYIEVYSAGLSVEGHIEQMKKWLCPKGLKLKSAVSAVPLQHPVGISSVSRPGLALPVSVSSQALSAASKAGMHHGY